jgi:thiamine transport system permease protein
MPSLEELDQLNRGRIISIFVYFFPLAAVAVFILYPILTAIGPSLVNSSGDASFFRILELLAEGRSRSIILFTFKQTIISTVSTLIMAIPGAYLLSKYRFPGRSLILSISMVPFILPPLVMAIGFFTLFGTSGHINSILSTIESRTFLDLPSLNILYSLEGIVLAHIFMNFPVALRLLHSGFSGMNPNLERASRSLGSGPMMTFFRITLPQVKYSLIAAISLVFTFCFLSFGVILVIGGGSNQTIETEIYRQFSGNLDFSKAGALLFVESLVVLLSTGVYVWASGKSEGGVVAVSRGLEKKGLKGIKPGLLSISASIYGLLIFIIVLGPMLSVIRESLTVGDTSGFHWFKQVLSDDVNTAIGVSPLDAVLNSLIFGFLCAVISLPVSFLAGYLLHRNAGSFNIPVHTLMLIPLGISSVGLGYGLVKAYSGSPIDPTGTWYIIVILHVLLSYPFGARVIRSGLASIPDDLTRASRSLGKGPISTFMKVHIPLLAPSFLVGSMGDPE